MEQNSITWEQILDHFISDIKKQKYGKDQRLPTENEVAVKYGVTRNEIRMVYKKLKEMGYIYSIRGCGSFYSGNRIKIPLCMGGGVSFSKKMKELGLDYRTENLEARRVRNNSNIYEAMQAASDEIIWKIVLLRFVSGEPVAIHTRYMSEKNFPNLPDDAHTILSSRDYLSLNGYHHLAGKDGQMAITHISKKKQDILHMEYKQEAMVLTGKTINADDNSILELFSTTYRPDCFLFTFNNTNCSL